MRHRPTTALLTLLFAGTPLLAQDYIVRVKRYPDAGRSAVCSDVETRKSTVKQTVADGKSQEQKTDGAKEETYTETVLEKGDKSPRKYRRAYDKAILTVAGKSYSRSYQGKTVLFEQQKDGRFAVKLQGSGELHPFDQQELPGLAAERADDMDDVILPKEPLKVGGKWQIDPRGLVRAYARAGELDVTRSSGEGVLLRVETKDGRPVGTLEVTLRLAVKAWEGVKFDPPARMDVSSTLTTVIDGSSTAASFNLTGRMTGRGVGEDRGRKFTVEVDATQTFKQERSAEK